MAGRFITGYDATSVVKSAKNLHGRLQDMYMYSLLRRDREA